MNHLSAHKEEKKKIKYHFLHDSHKSVAYSQGKDYLNVFYALYKLFLRQQQENHSILFCYFNEDFKTTA